MRYVTLLVLSFIATCAAAQENVVDKIVAVVGDQIVLKSDIENDLMHLQQARGDFSNTLNLRDEVFEQKLIQKLLLAQAEVDSVTTTDDEVEAQLNAQIDYYISEIGSQEQLEAFFGKPLQAIKDETRPLVRDNIITQRMQAKIVEDVRVTPSGVRSFYKTLDQDSLPDVPEKYEIQQIVVKPKVTDVEKERVRARLREFRDQIQSGAQSFTTLAVLYSEDPGSAPRGGDLGYITKTDMVPEFAAEAFSLKPGRLSKIVETEYGFHLIQCVDRQGDRMHARHILLRPKIDEEERQEAIHALDTITEYIEEEGLSFEEAALYFSADKQTRRNGGLLVDENTDSRLSRDKIRDAMAIEVAKLKVGEISEPFMDNSSGSEEYKIIKIKAYHPQHKANLEDDWSNFEEMLRMQKQQEVFLKWIREKQESTYIHIDDAYKNMTFRYDGWIK